MCASKKGDGKQKIQTWSLSKKTLLLLYEMVWLDYTTHGLSAYLFCMRHMCVYTCMIFYICITTFHRTIYFKVSNDMTWRLCKIQIKWFPLIILYWFAYIYNILFWRLWHNSKRILYQQYQQYLLSADHLNQITIK